MSATASTGTDNGSPLRIDIVSDVVCPWCAIGFYQLAAALERSGRAAEIHWHPFELHPDMAQGGEDYVAYLTAKYGTTPGQVAANCERLKALGAELGFTFNHGEGMRTYNSFAAHRLIHWAGGLGRAQEAKLALFRAFFTDGRAIDRTDVLLDVAAEIGSTDARPPWPSPRTTSQRQFAKRSGSGPRGASPASRR